MPAAAGPDFRLAGPVEHVAAPPSVQLVEAAQPDGDAVLNHSRTRSSPPLLLPEDSKDAAVAALHQYAASHLWREGILERHPAIASTVERWKRRESTMLMVVGANGTGKSELLHQLQLWLAVSQPGLKWWVS